MMISFRSRPSLSAAVAIVLCLGTSTTLATAAKAEDQFEKLMNKVGLPYKVGENGHYRFEIPLKDGRTQLVFVSDKVQEVGSMKVREVYSAGYVSDKPLAADIANQLLEDSEGVKIGGWALWHDQGRYIANFSVKMSANSGVDDLKTAIVVAARRADAIEKNLTGKDDL